MVLLLRLVMRRLLLWVWMSACMKRQIVISRITAGAWLWHRLRRRIQRQHDHMHRQSQKAAADRVADH